jgi:hypothetical protein
VRIREAGSNVCFSDRGERAGAGQDRGCKRGGDVAVALGARLGPGWLRVIHSPLAGPEDGSAATLKRLCPDPMRHQMITRKSLKKDQPITCGDGGRHGILRVTSGDLWTGCE